VNPVPVGLDDGYAYTKVALPGGRLVAVPSRARIGRAGVTELSGAERRIFEYETARTCYAVGDVDGEPTYFDGYPSSGLNRVIVAHALIDAGLAGQTVQVVSGLPVASFYFADGGRRTSAIEAKRASLEIEVRPVDGRLPASLGFHEVIPEALAAWYDYVITEKDGEPELDPAIVAAPVAIVDIGGRTTDYVVVADQAIRHESSGSIRCGMLDVRRMVAETIAARFDLEQLTERTIDHAMTGGAVRLFGRDEDVSEIVTDARREIVARLNTETERRLGRGAELERIVFVGGGALALAGEIRDWFSNLQIAPHPAFANARGMLKFLTYVCEPG